MHPPAPHLTRPDMLIVYLSALMLLGLLLGFTVHGAFLLLFALGFASMVVAGLVWAYAVATGRRVFFGRRL
ncbi:MAG: hypothetical protein N2Z63_03780 [Thiobacillaceae bacterium]|nr:hypothetical protein [Thiobacillaceae bacterium]